MTALQVGLAGVVMVAIGLYGIRDVLRWRRLVAHPMRARDIAAACFSLIFPFLLLFGLAAIAAAVSGQVTA